jgi:hypothetical protein
VDLVVIVPMLGRAHRVEPLLESIHGTCEARVLFAVSPGDVEVHEAIDRAHSERITVPRREAGDYARKIQAGIDASSEPFIFTGADDLRFHPGWYEAARSKMTDRVGVVGTNDLSNPRVMRGEHATHFLIARWYVALGTVDQPGVLMHDGYVHEYVDDELVGTARKRGAWAFAADSVVEHLHPMAGKAPMDDLYAAQARRMRASRGLHRRRRKLWI